MFNEDASSENKCPDPIGDQGLETATFFVLPKHGHQEVGQSNEREGMLKEKTILGVSANVGDAH